MTLRPRSITQLFLLGIVLVSLPLIVGSVSTLVYLDRLSEHSRSLVVRGLEIGRESEKLNDQIEDLERNARQYLVVGDADLYQLYITRHRRFTETLDWLEILMSEPGAGTLLGRIRDAGGTILDQLQVRADAVDAPVDTEHFDRLNALSGELGDFAARTVRRQLDSAAELADKGRSMLYWVWGASLSLTLILLVFFARFVARPINRLDYHVRRLGRGIFDDPIAIDGPSDVSELAGRLDWLRTRLIEIDDIKEQFFREMSHQLKTPLASIRKGTELLMDQSTRRSPDARKEIVEILHLNSLDLQRMLENMLDFSAWRADPRELHKETFHVRPLIEGIKDRYRVALLSQNLDLFVECPPDLTVNADRTKFRVVLDNLISNAIKYSPAGGEISTKVAEQRQGVVLDVVDQGPGVPADEREKVFELFYLGSGSAGSAFRGTGVGLALVQAYVKAHGGEVQVVADEHEGAHFRAVFPQA